jgi:hypothetical protein
MTEKLVAMTFEEASRWIASQEARIAQLEAALRSLRNEVHGSIYIDEREIRHIIGNTNFQCIERRLDEADKILGSSGETGTEHGDAVNPQGCREGSQPPTPLDVSSTSMDDMREADKTPPAFRDLLLSLARSARSGEANERWRWMSVGLSVPSHAAEAEVARLNMEMEAYRQKLTPKDAQAMTAVIKALNEEKDGRTSRFEDAVHDAEGGNGESESTKETDDEKRETTGKGPATG